MSISRDKTSNYMVGSLMCFNTTTAAAAAVAQYTAAIVDYFAGKLIIIKAREPHTCVCGKAVDARGLHGLSCHRSAPRQQRHSHLNDISWRAIKRAQMPAVKEPINLMRDDSKRPDRATLLPWARGKPMVWDVTVQDTYAQSHIGNTAAQ